MKAMTSPQRRAGPSRHHDLFAQPRLPGLSLFENGVPLADEQTLTAAIDTVELSPFRFQGWLGKRLTAAYGWSYDFDAGRLAPAAPIPDWLPPLRETAARLTGLPVDDLVQALLIRYDPGAGIGWHRDRPAFGHIVGVSLAAPATMRFRRRRSDGFDRAAVLLPSRSIYHMTGEVRHVWEHSIAPMDEPRWSVTFRTLATLASEIKDD
jgi:alkylated DNA repair protein (DNA oxidative demethylase)